MVDMAYFMSNIHDFDDNQISWKFAQRWSFVQIFHCKNSFCSRQSTWFLNALWTTFFGWPNIFFFWLLLYHQLPREFCCILPWVFRIETPSILFAYSPCTRKRRFVVPSPAGPDCFALMAWAAKWDRVWKMGGGRRYYAFGTWVTFARETTEQREQPLSLVSYLWDRAPSSR